MLKQVNTIQSIIRQTRDYRNVYAGNYIKDLLSMFASRSCDLKIKVRVSHVTAMVFAK